MKPYTKEKLELAAFNFVESAAENHIPNDGIYAGDVRGARIFDPPLFAYARADDELFEALRKSHVVGPHHKSPKWWMPEAETVISFFLPYSERIRQENRRDRALPAGAWLHGRIEGQRFLLMLAGHIAGLLRGAGHMAVIPDGRELEGVGDARFSAIAMPDGIGGGSLSFTSNWSERHVAYVCGLGTFSLSRSMITKRGCAGRFGSIITDLGIPPSGREYAGWDEYCIYCGECAANCPAGAISLKEGKDQVKCWSYLEKTKQAPPYYGCGKCQVGVPCETLIPSEY